MLQTNGPWCMFANYWIACSAVALSTVLTLARPSRFWLRGRPRGGASRSPSPCDDLRYFPGPFRCIHPVFSIRQRDDGCTSEHKKVWADVMFFGQNGGLNWKTGKYDENPPFSNKRALLLFWTCLSAKFQRLPPYCRPCPIRLYHPRHWPTSATAIKQNGRV